jgi:uncharacterized protein YukE
VPDTTLREFVIGLGFSLDQAGEQKFVNMIQGATLRANLLATALEDMAKTVATKVGEVASSFEQLYYQSQRTLTSPQGILAFKFAFEQLGSTVGEAAAALETFGYRLRTQPGFENRVKGLGIATRDANNHLRDSSEILTQIVKTVAQRHSPALSNVFREFLGGVSDQGWQTLNNPDFWNQYNKALTSEKGAGLGANTAEAAVKFEKAWREAWMRVGNLAEGGETKLLSALTGPMEKFNKWLDDHSTELNTAIGRIADSLDGLAISWTGDLAQLVLGDDQARGIDDTSKAISKFLDSLKPLVSELKAFNDESKDWWFIKLINKTASGGLVAPLPSNDDFYASHGSGVGAGWFGGLWNGVKNFFGGGGNKGIGGWWTPDRMSHAVDRLMKEAGLSREGAAGLVARWSAIEASGGPASANASGHVGIGQWDSARGGEAMRGADFDTQLGHAISELNTTEARAAAQLRSAKTAGEGALGASMFERAEGWNAAAGTDNFTASTPVDKVLKAVTPALARPVTPSPLKPAAALPAVAPLAWDTGNIWAGLNAQLPVGPTSTDNSQKNVTSTVNNSITVNGADSQPGPMVGTHLDRAANDIARNLQGAFQ